MLYSRMFLLFLYLCAGAVCAQSVGQPFIRHYDGVLGTSLDLTIYGVPDAEAEAAFGQVLTHIAELESVLSTYQSDSELMQLNEQRTMEVSTDLQQVLGLCSRWYLLTEGKFSCKMGQVIDIWEAAETSQEVPDRIEVRRLAWSANQEHLDANAPMITLPPTVDIEPSGMTKGHIIFVASELLQELLPGKPFKLDIGGDAYYSGRPPGQEGWQVAVANPLQTADNAGFLATLALQDKGIAASGHTSRPRQIGRRSFSHILTPRDGWPVIDAPSAIVVAEDAQVADVIATALTVMDISEGIDWVDSLPGVEALVVSAGGLQFRSANWQALLSPEDSRAAVAGAPVLTMDYTIPDIDVASYHSPYVAIWITDTNNKAVKNLLLLGESERWARENGRWWRRVGRRDPDLLDGVARPTRAPGAYHLEWDGRDDFGEVVPDGNYVLHMEASRELGEHDYRNIDIRLGPAATIELETDGELGAATINIR